MSLNKRPSVGYFRLLVPFIWSLLLLPTITQAATIIFLTSTTTTTWTVPSDWNSSNNKIETIGGGGGGGAANGTGGGGGAYAEIANLSLTPGNIINIQVGPGGAGAPASPSNHGTDGGDTYFNRGASATTTCSTQEPQSVCAKGGSQGNDSINAGPAGGSAGSSIGSVKHNGGNGGANDFSGDGGSGGGGAANAQADGAAGGDQSVASGFFEGGGGGGGSGGGTAGATASGGGSNCVGGNGGDNSSSSGHGSGGGASGCGASSAGTNGSNGGGGGGGGGSESVDASAGGSGGNGTEWGASHGSGGGGGGGGGNGFAGGAGGVGGAGGLYGAGGGAGGFGNNGFQGAGGNGAQGIIVITYTPAKAIIGHHGLGKTIIGHFNNVSVSNGLVGYWPFDGRQTNWTTGVTNDVSGNGNNGQMIGMSTSTSPIAGKIGQALKFNGASTVSISPAPVFNPSSPFTVAGWFKTSSSAGMYLFDEQYPAIPTLEEVDIDSGVVEFCTSDDSLSGPCVDSSGTGTNYANDKWHHFAIVSGSRGFALYIDGADVANNPPTVYTSFTGAPTFYIGSARNVTGFLNGTLDDVRIYNRALNAQEIRQLYGLGRVRI